MTERASKQRQIIFAVLLAALIVGAGLAIGLGVGLSNRNDGSDTSQGAQAGASAFKSSTKNFHYAAVAADSDIASQIGTDILARKGGNAVDATIAALFATGVMSAHSTGIGGGAFFTIYIKETDQWYSIDARESAPAFATRDMYVNHTEDSLLGGLAIGVPGEVKGMLEMHKAFGKTPWRELVMPTARLCREGVPLTQAAYKALDRVVQTGQKGNFSIYFDENGNKKPVGSLIVHQELAATFETIANNPEHFYDGDLAQKIVEDINEVGGKIVLDDLKNYALKNETPTSITIHGDLTVHSTPAPGSGPVLSYILSILSGYGFQASSVSSTESTVLTYHRIIEAMKYAYAKRTELGDQSFSTKIAELARSMTTLALGEETRQKISDDSTHATADYNPGGVSQDDSGTTQLSVVDGAGNAVSVTSSVNTYFGSKVRGSRTGIIFNNGMDDFSTPGTVNYFGVPASETNFIEPGKRAMSSMCPAIVYDNNAKRVVLVTGAAGGTKITTATALNIADVLWFNMSLGQSVDQKRFHHQLFPEYLQLEPDFPQDILKGLTKKGHKTGDMRGHAVVQAVHIHDNGVTATSDYRKGGKPAGF